MLYKTKSSVAAMIQDLDSEYKNLVSALTGSVPISDLTGKPDPTYVAIDERQLRLSIDKFSAVLKEAKSFAK